MKMKSLFTSLMIALAAGTAAAEQDKPKEDTIEELIVLGQLSQFGATKSQVPVVETARSISIETEFDFIQKGALNLSQTTSYLAGITAETFGFATRGDWISSRGLTIPRYRDSIQELFGSYNSTRADVYTLEQVEVLKGPASVLYGQGTPGGIVNVVSKVARPDTQDEIVLTAGSNDRMQLGLDHTFRLSGDDDRWLMRFVGLHRDSDTQVDNVEDDASIFMPSISYRPSDDTSITLSALIQESDADTGAQFVPIAGTLVPLADGTRIDQDVFIGEPEFNRFDTESNQVTALIEHQINDVWAFSATALWRDGEADYHQAWPVFVGAGNSRFLNDIAGFPIASNTTVPRSFYQADNTFEQNALDVRFKADFDTGAVSHEFMVGAQYQDVETDNNTAYFYGGGALDGDFSYVLDLANPQYTGAPDQSVFDAIYTDRPLQKVDDFGLYLSDQISWGDWRFTLGLRYDEVDNDTGAEQQSDDEVSTSFGALYTFDNGLSPYISYAESFETVVGTTASGEQLQPQLGDQIEIGLKYEPQSFPGLFTLAYFDIDISNLPNPNSIPADAGQQLGVANISGVEFEGRAHFGDVYMQLALSFLDGEDPNGFELSNQPDSNHSLWLKWEPSEGDLKGFRFGAGVRHVGESVSEVPGLRIETPSYTVGDLLVGYQFSDKWDLAVNVRNFSDKEYLTSCLTRGDCFPGVRRTVNATLRFNY